uniref:Uncharacterized protein n=1 Tax=viral metagenome TaxID=1070528 RepID=A0A6C0DGP6_9ZZZZ
MSYRVHVYVLDNNEQDYIGDIIVLEGDTVEDVERFIMTSLLGHIYHVPFDLTGVRIVGRRNGYDIVDFRDSKEIFTEAIRKKRYTAKVLEYNHFDLSIELRDLDNAIIEYNYANNIGEYNNVVNNDPMNIVEPSSSGASGSNKQVYGGKRKTMRKTKRKALKTKRHHK